MKFTGFCLAFLFISFSLNAQNKNDKELMEQDWPQLNRYREANRKIIKNANWPEVVFMGNSITEGWVNTQSRILSKE